MNETTHNPNPGLREDLNAAGNQIAETVKGLVAKGNVRSVVVQKDGRTIVELPLTIGVIGALLAPQLALLGVVVAMLAQCSISIRTREVTPPRV